jgi:hypothetical protein
MKRARQPRLPIGEVSNGPFEVHEHTFLSGPRAKFSPAERLVHSHEGGERPHQHAEVGPATYTIDKDDWFRLTGFRGGGKKTFTKRPSGEQLPIVELEDLAKVLHDSHWQTAGHLHRRRAGTDAGSADDPRCQDARDCEG